MQCEQFPCADRVEQHKSQRVSKIICLHTNKNHFSDSSHDKIVCESFHKIALRANRVCTHIYIFVKKKKKNSHAIWCVDLVSHAQKLSTSQKN